TGACLEKKRAHDREIHLHEQVEKNYARLQELEGQRDGLTYMIVHDLRTPLCSLISGLQTLPAMGELGADQCEVLEIALAGGETLLGMVNSLLDVEKMESGAMKLDYTLLDASELITCAISQVSDLVLAGDLTLVRALDSDLPFFEGDEDKLRRTLVNLLGNAIKFTPAGGTITAAAHAGEDKQSLIFSVSDTGEGIPEEDFERIFDKFGQVSSRQGGRLMSTGLGLTFCKLAVEAHGGKISASNAPGQGSTLSFNVPIKPVQTIAV
ncbi:MAG: hypothetical protein H7Y17_14385, partial [Chlorobia bacterium]|nr:hypothetical protein [Fimbriimonadaceae bacterium]